MTFLAKAKTWLEIKLGLRENECDVGVPGPERPMTGLLSQLPPDRRAALDKAFHAWKMKDG